jgi:hypothetical protein
MDERQIQKYLHEQGAFNTKISTMKMGQSLYPLKGLEFMNRRVSPNKNTGKFLNQY